MLALAGIVLSLASAALFVLAGQRRARGFTHDLDRLHDEVWELREAAAARDRAEAANEAKSRFLASVSHEVRTPLNGILGMAELLDGTPLNAEQKTYLAAIRTSGSALASLIDEILDLSKIEAGKVDLVEDVFDPVDLVEGVAELLSPRAQGKGLEIASSIAPDVPRRVIGDPVRLRQILINLAGNAVKFTETGGVGFRVVRPHADRPELQFDIIDTGPGVPADRRAAIFEDFEQADKTTTRLHGGTGLGLAISKSLAELMGGSLTLAPSVDGEGSLFSIVVPLPSADQDDAGDAGARLDEHKVLIVADSLFEAPFVARQLAEAGAEVTHVKVCEEGLANLRRGSRFDIVIFDCALGEEAVAALGEAARAAKAGRTLLLFSPFERRAFGQSFARGFDGWLVKPVRRKSLFDLVTTEKTETPRAQSWPLETSQSSHVNVLLAEDNEINAMLATRHLERLGATVTHAPDGLVALALTEAALDAGTPYDAMVLDIRMPGLDGLELARRIRLAENAHGVAPARLVALSADLADGERRSASFAGIDECLGKPVSFARLERALGYISESRIA